MSKFEEVTATFGVVKHMREPEAQVMRDLIVEQDASDILEIGFCHGKSSAYLAAILEDLGRGHLVTIDNNGARQREPNIEHVLSMLNLSHRVTPVFAERSYTWEMGKMIRVTPRPQFDLCYFDGGHTWDVTGFGFVLVDMLLRPGGWIVFDDLRWTIDAAIAKRDWHGAKVPSSWRRASEDERATPGVQLVFDTLVPHLGYTSTRAALGGRWGVAQKPLHETANRVPRSRPGAFGQIVSAFTRR